MDPRTALLQQESDDNGKGFRNKSIGMHNLRAKLREQLKGYSHVRGDTVVDTATFVKLIRSIHTDWAASCIFHDAENIPSVHAFLADQHRGPPTPKLHAVART